MIKRLFVSALLCGVSLEADSVSFTFYNDFFAGSDGHFTNGGALSWLETGTTKEKSYTNAFLRAAQGIVPLSSTKEHNAGLSLTQMIITPKNTELINAQYADYPYAGYLAVSAFLLEWDQEHFSEYSVEVGIMGKYSGAEWVQKTFHKMIGNQQPQGWDTQLGTHYTLNFLLQKGVKSWQGSVGDTLKADWLNHYGVTLGNFNTSVFAGSSLRLGHNYVQNFNAHYPYLKSEASLLDADSLKHGFGWSTSIGVETKVLAYSAILDKAVDSGYATHKNILNALVHLSGSLYYNQHKLSLFYEIPTAYTKEDHSTNVIGGFEYSYKF